MGRMRAVPRLWELQPGICLTCEEKGRKNLSQGSAESGTRTNVVCFRRVLLSRVNCLGYASS